MKRLAVAMSAVFLSSASAHACSCEKALLIGDKTMVSSARFDAAQIVVDGTVGRVEVENQVTYFTIKVQKAAKGWAGNRVLAATGTGNGDCGLRSEIETIANSGRSFRFFGFVPNPHSPFRVWLTSCAPPIEMEDG